MKRWKTLTAIAALVTSLSMPVFGQEGSAGGAEEKSPLEVKLEKKLDSEFLKKGKWYTDFDEAKKAAAEQGKPIFAYFSRSYAP